jgi:hypothetical protein
MDDRECTRAALFRHHRRRRVHGVHRASAQGRALASDRGYRRDDGSAERRDFRLIAEILSPSNTRTEVELNLRRYRRELLCAADRPKRIPCRNPCAEPRLAGRDSDAPRGPDRAARVWLELCGRRSVSRHPPRAASEVGGWATEFSDRRPPLAVGAFRWSSGGHGGYLTSWFRPVNNGDERAGRMDLPTRGRSTWAKSRSRSARPAALPYNAPPMCGARAPFRKDP